MHRLLFALSLLSGCAPGAIERVSASRAQGELNLAVAEYWKVLRWGEAGDLLVYFRTPDDQAKVAKAFADARVRMQDAQILFVAVGADLPPERQPATREGIATVHVESFNADTGRLVIENFEQHWLYVANHWVVDTEKSPLGDDRAW